MTQMRPIPWHTRDIIAALGISDSAALSEHLFPRISTDSRNISADALFVALKGENFDAHHFVPSLVDRGIKGFIIEKHFHDHLLPHDKEKLHGQDVSLFCVDNTRDALGKLAAFQRRRAGVKVLGITGSCGKTTTREMAAAIFRQKYSVLSTKGNFNNEIGLPLTLLELSFDHDWAVVEMGMNHAGEITRLGRMARPDIGIITNTFRAHLAGLGSVAAVARAKSELIPCIKDRGTVILNRDDDQCPVMVETARQHGKQCFFFTTGTEGDLKASHMETTSDALSFTLSTTVNDVARTTGVILPTPAPFMVKNALAAASAALVAGLDLSDIRRGLTAFQPVTGRFEITALTRDIKLINDTYNANPDSTTAALDMLARQNAPTIAVLGDMLELGDDAPALHHEIGRQAATAGISHLFVHGDMADQIIEGAVSAGFPPAQTVSDTKAALFEKIKTVVVPGMWILVKGSRGMHMEQISQALENCFGKGN